MGGGGYLGGEGGGWDALGPGEWSEECAVVTPPMVNVCELCWRAEARAARARRDTNTCKRRWLRFRRDGEGRKGR